MTNIVDGQENICAHVLKNQKIRVNYKKIPIFNEYGEITSYTPIFHNKGGPAVTGPDGFSIWMVENMVHRDGDLPAMTFPDGSQKWCKNNVYHRDNGLPAFIRADGHKEWWVNGKLHRIDGPAIERPNGDKEYFLNGVFQRSDRSLVDEPPVIKIR